MTPTSYQIIITIGMLDLEKVRLPFELQEIPHEDLQYIGPPNDLTSESHIQYQPHLLIAKP